MNLISSNIALDWKSVTTTFVKEFESIDACSIKSVDKGQLYELYNHFLHYSVRVSTIRQE